MTEWIETPPEQAVYYNPNWAFGSPATTFKQNQPWQCPDCKMWMAWWVPTHRCDPAHLPKTSDKTN